MEAKKHSLKEIVAYAAVGTALLIYAGLESACSAIGVYLPSSESQKEAPDPDYNNPKKEKKEEKGSKEIVRVCLNYEK